MCSFACGLLLENKKKKENLSKSIGLACNAAAAASLFHSIEDCR
jgi:hypothetical protein